MLPLPPQFLDAVTRLVTLLDSPKDVRTLAPLVLREITYRVLVGPQGANNALRRPMDVAVDEALNLYIADAEEGLLVLSAEGKLLALLGAAMLKRPTALARARDGSLYVYDEKLKRVLRFR